MSLNITSPHPPGGPPRHLAFRPPGDCPRPAEELRKACLEQSQGAQGLPGNSPEPCKACPGPPMACRGAPEGLPSAAQGARELPRSSRSPGPRKSLPRAAYSWFRITGLQHIVVRIITPCVVNQRKRIGEPNINQEPHLHRFVTQPKRSRGPPKTKHLPPSFCKPSKTRGRPTQK